MKLNKLTLEGRVNNIENRIRKLESVLMRERDDNRYVLFDDKQIAFYEDDKSDKSDKSDKNQLSRETLRRFYTAFINGTVPASLDSTIKSCCNSESSSNEMLLMLIILKAITMYNTDK